MPPSIVSFKRRLQGHVQQGGFFAKIDLRSAQAFQSIWENVQLESVKANMVDFRGSKWVGSTFRRVVLDGSNFNAANLHDVGFDGCDMEQTSFAGAVIRNVTFRDCRLAYASFVGATLDNVRFSDCNLHGTDLDVAEATGVAYLGCNHWGAKAAFGCGFWNAKFDEATCDRFAAMLARIHPNPEAKLKLISISGENTYGAVCRLMDNRQDQEPPEF